MKDSKLTQADTTTMADIAEVNTSRRKFLSKAAIAGSITIAPGVFLHQTARAADTINKNTSVSTRPLDEDVSSKNRWGMLIDTNKCAKGCTGCVDACNQENGLAGAKHDHLLSDQQYTQYIRKVTLKDKSTGHELSLPFVPMA